jgi:hypothetical protein
LDSVVDSLSIGSDGSLTENGPYQLNNAGLPWGLDITRDGKYALFNVQLIPCEPVCTALVAAFPIQSDGSLGPEVDFQPGPNGPPSTGGWLRLSPNERFLFWTPVPGLSILSTLNFTENPLNITYSGCTTNLRTNVDVGSMATVLPSGAGGDIYVTEFMRYESVALLTIDPATGCTTEVPASPFYLGPNKDGYFTSLSGWPPRPF